MKTTSIRTESIPRITITGFLIASLFMSCPHLVNAGDAALHDPSSPISAESALERLMQGNKRYTENASQHIDQTAEIRAALSKGQHPFAVVITCSDSRVPPELVFDQGLGDLFVIRNAGNVLDDHVIGTIEYAVEHLHVPLLVVLGHESCGAVTAAVKGGEVPGHIRSIVDSIQPAVDACKDKSGDPVDNAVRANVSRVTRMLTHIEPFINEAVASGHLKIVGARYELTTGRVEIIP